MRVDYLARTCTHTHIVHPIVGGDDLAKMSAVDSEEGRAPLLATSLNVRTHLKNCGAILILEAGAIRLMKTSRVIRWRKRTAKVCMLIEGALKMLFAESRWFKETARFQLLDVLPVFEI